MSELVRHLPGGAPFNRRYAQSLMGLFAKRWEVWAICHGLDPQHRILTAFARVITDKGLHACSVTEILRQAGMGRDTFYKTFASKQAVAHTLLATACPSLAQRLAGVDLWRSGLGTLAVELVAARYSGDQGADAELAQAHALIVAAAQAELQTSEPASTEQAETFRSRLPRGRHGLPKEFVLENQRHRLLRSLAWAIAERGYEATTVADVTTAARVSRRTFYEHFSSKQVATAALLAATVDLPPVDLRFGSGRLIAELVANRAVGRSVAELLAEAEVVLGEIPTPQSEEGQ